ncbi:MAG TPA: amino acid adenylation domain-containing protein [Kofleriaceae bacterium]|nr:amino acid adenylation domain-containing protein [Kofleriaceae bacterium]
MSRAPGTASSRHRLLEALKAARGLKRATEAIPARPPGVTPLSFAQERLWFLDQLHRNSALYNIPAALWLPPIDVRTLERCIGALIERHEALRTVFPAHGGRPVQRVLEPRPYHLPVIDLGDLSRWDAAAEVDRLARIEANRPFDLWVGPLLRSTVIRVDDRRTALLVTMHHIISDGWSMGVFFRELWALYDAFSAGRGSPLPPLPIQYADFAAWQRDELRGDVLADHVAYWRAQLSDSPFVLELPADQARPTVQDYQGAAQSFRISAELVRALEALAKDEQATLFMVLISAFYVLLHRYTGERVLLVGTPIANRRRSELEGLIGFFANTLVLRGDLREPASFRELLRRVRDVTLAAYAHQDLPFEKLVEELQPQRGLSHNPIFQVMFALQNMPTRGALSGTGIGSAPDPARDRTVIPCLSKFDLMMALSQDDHGLLGGLEYTVPSFGHDRMTRLIDHYLHLLEGIALDPERAIDDHEIMPPHERRALEAWNQTARPVRGDSPVRRIAQHAAWSPELIAIEAGDEHWTYRRLADESDRLAARLIAAGVAPEDRVALCMPRSPWLIVSILAVLKAGGAYVPIDPTYPAARRHYMLANAGVRLVLAHRVPDLECDAPVLAPDAPGEDDPARPVSIDRSSPDQIAYVLYTSGSTGTPKGVEMPLGPLHNLIAWQIEGAGARGAARTLQFSSPSFDVSFQEIFCTLGSGGTLVMLSDAQRRDMEQVFRVLCEREIERIFLPFVALQQLADIAASQPDPPRHLRDVITAGEQLQVNRSIVRLFERMPGCSLHNQYGPTESHVVTEWSLRGDPSSWPAVPPIGRPIPNAQIHILDDRLRTVPIGIPGELYIAGPVLARGYAGRAQATAERFVPSPAGTPGARMYRTGDRARYRADGSIEFLGRADDQLKIRGFRVEPAEIEITLLHHDAIDEAVVVAREASSGQRSLVAYIVPAAGSGVDATALRSFVQARLPEFMVPSAFVIVDALPLTPSGKVDRRALAARPLARPELLETSAPLEAGLEREIARIWSSLLETDGIQPDDDFFALGGHSILATRLVSQLRSELHVELPLQAIFEHTTVAAQAHQLVKAWIDQLPRGNVVALLNEVETAADDALDRWELLPETTARTPGMPTLAMEGM